MQKNKSFYITTALPYVNAKPHIGHALEVVRADAVARYKELSGFEVFFNTGTDEHGMKIYRKAKEEGKDPKEYVDENALHFKNLLKKLGIKEDIKFIRTTDPNHVKAAQEFWKICDKNGYIYKKDYKVKYCVGCEMEKTDSDLVNGCCPEHPNQELEIIEEENYFFKFSSFQDKLLEYYQKNTDFVVPKSRFNDIKAFIERGLQDFSISRRKEKMPWGVEVPGDSDHVMYVWFDALVNYISTLSWPEDKETFEKFWVNGNPVQYCGKDNLRQQTAMWQAMLASVDLPFSDKVVVNGFVITGGQKMSKSLGNVINPLEIIDEYGTDALRYYVLRELHPFEDSDMTMDKFKEAYNANLVNGLGNLVSRVMKMAESNLDNPIKKPEKKEFNKEYLESWDNYNLSKVCDYIWQKIGEIDEKITETEPFKVVKENKEKGKEIITQLVSELYFVGQLLNPILPETSAKIKELILENKMPEKPLFPRKD